MTISFFLVSRLLFCSCLTFRLVLNHQISNSVQLPLLHRRNWTKFKWNPAGSCSIPLLAAATCFALAEPVVAIVFCEVNFSPDLLIFIFYFFFEVFILEDPFPIYIYIYINDSCYYIKKISKKLYSFIELFNKHFVYPLCSLDR